MRNCKNENRFFFRNTNQKYRRECIRCCSIKQKEWRDKINEKSKNHKKQYYEENREKIRNQQKNYYDENPDVIIKNQINYGRNRRETDVNFRLIRNTRRRIHHALNGKSKSSSNVDFLGIDIDLYREWIVWQFKPEMNWSNKEVDNVKPIRMFDVSKDEELGEAFSWKNTQPLLTHEH